MKTSLPFFQFLLLNFGREQEFPFEESITPASTTDIWRIKAEYLREDMAWRKWPPPETMPIVDPLTLASKASTPTRTME
ncbi:hypothetical protein R3W88_033824 [Solanum pinnatisectum]|uniref:Uncharacterized protein n=1 Tax=Solanum pinnatisectum TaxID=50273 RepID=A0AAV9K098_9SOLN|nr:hypothetical protein R3W88_033824 [Solanum pinnatisectum]